MARLDWIIDLLASNEWQLFMLIVIVALAFTVPDYGLDVKTKDEAHKKEEKRD